MSEVKIVINASGGAQAKGEAKQAADGFKELAAQAKNSEVSAGKTRQAFAQLPAQINDTFVSLAGGQSPLMVLLQQGTQVTDSFGGIGNAGRALATVFTPLRVLIGGTAAAAAALALANNQAQNEQAALKNAMAASGNAAGTSADQLNRYAREVAGVSGTVGGAVDALAALVASGRVGSGELTSAAVVAVRAQKLLGTSIADTVQAYAALGRDPVAASLKLNEGTNYLTAAVLRQITAFKAQGNEAAAAALAQDAYTAAQTRGLNEVEKNLGTLEKAWKATRETAKDWWDQVVGIGRPESFKEQLDAVIAVLDAAQKPLAQRLLAFLDLKNKAQREAGIGNAPGLGDLRSQAQKDEQVQALQDRKAALEESQRLEKRANAAREKLAAKERDALEELSPARQQARAAIDLQIAIGDAEAEKRARQAALQDLQTQRDADLVRLDDYVIKKAQLQAEELQADLRIIAARRAAEAAVDPQDVDGRLNKAARLLALSNQQAAVEQALVRNRGDAKTGLPSQANRELNATFDGEVKKATAEVLNENADRIRERQNAATQALADLVLENRKASIEMIKDDRARGQAQIAFFREQEQAKLAALAGDPAAYAAGQAAVNEAVRLKAAELSEKLKPEWRRMLEDWQDTNRLMARAVDSSFTTALKSAEDAFVQFAQTGKLSIKGLVNSVIAEFARAQFRQGIAALINFIGTGGNWSGMSESPGADRIAPDAYAKGGAFTNRIVDTATPFKFAQGGALRRGLMGEAGPEAIMPLTRDASGRLGVRAQGGDGGVTYHVTVQGDATASTGRMIEEALARFEQRRRRMQVA